MDTVASGDPPCMAPYLSTMHPNQVYERASIATDPSNPERLRLPMFA